MSEEHARTLEALGALAREEQQQDRTWEALCDPNERARTLQGASGSLTLDQATIDATMPLSAEAQARIVERVRAALQPSSARAPLAGVADPANENAAPLPLRRKRPSARAAPRRPAPKVTRNWAGLALPLIAAAAALLIWLQPVHTPSRLPEYSLEARASSGYRGDPRPDPVTGPLVVPSDGLLELELRPDVAYLDALELRVQLQGAAQTADLRAQVEQSPQGALRVRIARAQLPARGTASLLITVARPGAVPPTAALDSNAAQGEGWQSWRLELALP